MGKAIEILQEKLDKLDRLYDEFVTNGNVSEDSWSTKKNRAESEDLRNAIKILTTCVETGENTCNLHSVSNNESDLDCDYDLNVKVPFKTKRYKMKVINEVAVCELCGTSMMETEDGHLKCMNLNCNGF